jgi:hypothetical protein
VALEALRSGVEVETVEIDFGGRQTGAEGAIGETLQVLIGEIQALRSEVAELKSLPQIENRHEVEAAADRQHSLLVRLALKIDSWVRK